MNEPTNAQRRDRWCDIRTRRADDLTDQDVIAWEGQWTEVADVIRDMNAWDAVYGPSRSEERKFAEDSLDWASPVYVVLRLFDIKNSNPGELADRFVRVYRYDLIQVQVLPAYIPEG